MEACVAYARKIIGGRWDELESLLFKAVLAAPESFE